MSELLTPKSYDIEKTPSATDLSVMFTDEGMQLMGGNLYKYQPHKLKPGRTDYSAIRRAAAEILIDRQGEMLDEKELWVELNGEEPLNSQVMSRVKSWLTHVEHDGRFVFNVTKPYRQERGALKVQEKYFSYGVASSFDVSILHNPEEQPEVGVSLAEAIGKIALQQQSNL